MTAAEARGELAHLRAVRPDQHLRVAGPFSIPTAAAAAAAASTTAPISAGSSSLGHACVERDAEGGRIGAVKRSVTVSG